MSFKNCFSSAMSKSLEVPRTAARSAQHAVCLIVVQETLVHRIPLELALKLKRDVAENAKRRDAMARFHVHDRLLARPDAIFEILGMTGTAKGFPAVALCAVVFRLRLGRGAR